MGCDIHVYCERYDREENKWEALSLYSKKEDGAVQPVPIYTERDYDLFGILAGVRSYRDPLVYPRGLPDDLSPYVKTRWEDGKDDNGKTYWHTPTWYDFCELSECHELLAEFDKKEKQANDKIRSLEKKLEELKDELDDDWEQIEVDEEDDWTGVSSLGWLLRDVNKVLEAYGTYFCNPSDVRIVMWFDS